MGKDEKTPGGYSERGIGEWQRKMKRKSAGIEKKGGKRKVAEGELSKNPQIVMLRT